VPQSKVPGERLSATQPFPTKPAPFDLQGRTEEHLIDYTPEIHAMALELARANKLLAPFFNPPTHAGDPAGPALVCPGGGGGANILGPSAADPVDGIMFVTSQSDCGSYQLVPGADSPYDKLPQTGTTRSDWSRSPVSQQAGAGHNVTLDGIPIFKGPVGRIVAIDMNTGENLWTIPNGDASTEEQELIRNHPLLEGVEGVEVNRGRRGLAAMLVTPTLLIAGGQASDGTPELFAIDKRTGERVGAVPLPDQTRYGMSSWVHEGRQYVIVQLPDGIAAMGLPQP